MHSKLLWETLKAALLFWCWNSHDNKRTNYEPVVMNWEPGRCPWCWNEPMPLSRKRRLRWGGAIRRTHRRRKISEHVYYPGLCHLHKQAYGRISRGLVIGRIHARGTWTDWHRHDKAERWLMTDIWTGENGWGARGMLTTTVSNI